MSDDQSVNDETTLCHIISYLLDLLKSNLCQNVVFILRHKEAATFVNRPMMIFIKTVFSC